MTQQTKLNTYKHSGTTGDLIYSLALVQHLGPGAFYLHLDQINWIGSHYYGSKPDPFHQGRMNQGDYQFLKRFIEAQPYISSFECLDSSVAITHNLDRFRPLFVHHPGNYVDVYCQAFGIDDPAQRTQIRTTPWLHLPEGASPRRVGDRDVVINRTSRWLPPQLSDQWARWRAEGLEARAIFVGLESEYHQFRAQTGLEGVPWEPTQDLLDLAQLIAGARLFIGNQSQALAVAIGLGVPYACEARKDLPPDRNECYFPNQPNSRYF